MDTSGSALIFLLLLAICCRDASALELSITPAHAHVQTGERVKIMCQADRPLVGCQFKRIFSGALYDLGMGAATPFNKEFAYYGTGLESGQCGVSVTEYVREHTYDLIGCRVRATGGNWQFAQMSLVINGNASYTMSISPPRPVVLPGGNVTVTCQADQPISGCLFKWNNQTWTSLNASTSTPLYAYSGAGLERGQCGITFRNATPALAGNVFCSAWTKARPKGYEAATVPLTVAELTAPVLTLAKTPLAGNATLNAWCAVRRARPPPRITWLLGDAVVGVDACADDAAAAWRWPHEAAGCTATLALPVAGVDDGKLLVCRVEHVALPGGRLDATRTVEVLYPAVAPASPILLYGFGVDRAAEVTVHVAANPRPTFTWTLGNESLAEGDALDGDRVQALRATKDACGWQATLVIASLAQSDLDEELRLAADSAQGSANFRLRLSTAAAPSGVATPAPCDSRVKHAPAPTVADVATPTPPTGVDGNETRRDSLTHEEKEPSGCHTGLTVVIMLLVVVVGFSLTWYARSKKLWCFASKQFARSSLRDDCEDTEDADVLGRIH